MNQHRRDAVRHGNARSPGAVSLVEVIGNKWRARCRCLSGLPLLSEQLIIGKVESAVCVLCSSGEVEDVTHAITTCACYASDRAALVSEVTSMWTVARQQRHAWWVAEEVQWCDMNATQQTQWLLRCNDEQMRYLVSVYLFRLFRARTAAVAAAAAAARGKQ